MEIDRYIYKYFFLYFFKKVKKGGYIYKNNFYLFLNLLKNKI